MAVECAGFEDDAPGIDAHWVIDPASTIAAEVPMQFVAAVGSFREDLGLPFDNLGDKKLAEITIGPVWSD